MATWTGPHASCADSPFPRVDNHTIVSGDVFGMHESVYAAIYDVLNHSHIVDRVLWSRCRIAALELRQKEYATKKIRPCIMMDNDTDPLTLCKPRKICVTVSWEKTPLAELPELHQHFSVNLSPNHRKTRNHPKHYHSYPREWSIEDAFVFAWPFKSKRPLLYCWPSKEAGNPTEEPCVFGEVAMANLDQDCHELREKWLWKCQTNPDFADKQAHGCLKHTKKVNEERAKADKRRSRISFRSGVSQTPSSLNYRRTSIASGKSRLSSIFAGVRRRAGGAKGENWRGQGGGGADSESWRRQTEGHLTCAPEANS